MYSELYWGFPSTSTRTLKRVTGQSGSVNRAVGPGMFVFSCRAGVVQASISVIRSPACNFIRTVRGSAVVKRSLSIQHSARNFRHRLFNNHRGGNRSVLDDRLLKSSLPPYQNARQRCFRTFFMVEIAFCFSLSK